MRKLYLILSMAAVSIGIQAQNVTTFLNSDEADIDDALVFDSRGNLYGSNFIGNTVYKITPFGEVTPFVSGLKNPNGLAFDHIGNLFVAEYGKSIIHKYDKNGNLLQSFEVDGVPSGMIKSKYRNTILFTDVLNNSIKELFPDGRIETVYEGAPLNIPVGLAFDRKGTLYIGNYLDRKIYKLSSRNATPEYIATVPDSGTIFPYLAFITFAKGYLYGTNYGEHKVYKINPRTTDDVEVFAGSTDGNNDGDVSEATFSYPAGIVADRSGRKLYVSEFSGVGNIRKISPKQACGSVAISVKISPNPVMNILSLAFDMEYENEGSLKIKIYEFLNRKLVFESQETFSKGKFTKEMNVKNWKKGLYVVQVSGDGQKGTQLFIKH